MKLKKIFLTIFLAAFGLMVLSFSSSAYEKTELKFNSDGKFTILLFTDIEETELPMSDSVKLWDAAIEKVKPDLIVYNGDNQKVQQSTDAFENVKQAITEITKPASENSIPFAVIFGSNDANCGVSKDKQLGIYKSISGCLNGSENASSSGSGAFNITIKSSTNESDAFSLWFFDTCTPLGDDDTPFKPSAQKQAESQNQWYEKKSELLKEKNDGKPLPSLVFQHEPVPEIYNLLKKTDSKSSDSVKGQGDNSSNYYIKSDETSGTLNKGPYFSSYMDGRFDLWKQQGDVIGAFFGHDHRNDIGGTVDGIYLSQTFKSGVRGYGEAKYSGVRVITLDENDTSKFDTYSLSLPDLIGIPTNLFTVFRTSYAVTVKIAAFGGIGSALIVLAVAAIKRILTRRKNLNGL